MFFKLFRRIRNLYLGSTFNVSVGRGLNFGKGSSVTFGKNVKLGNSNTLTAKDGKILLGYNFNSNDAVILNADLGGNVTFGEKYLNGRDIFLGRQITYSRILIFQLGIRVMKYAISALVMTFGLGQKL